MSAYNKQSPETIQKMFGSIADHYDQANAFLSMNMHKRWNRTLVKEVTNDQGGLILLDLCAGTGDISFDYLKHSKGPSRAILLDFCHEMLDSAAKKEPSLGLEKHTIEYVQGDAQHIPFGDRFASCITIAYGIRNIKEPMKCLEEAFRVLQPEGKIGILELTEPSNPLLRKGHNLYLRMILPTLGKFITANEDAYQYLQKSIKEFVPPAKLEEMLKSVGFKQTKRIPLAGGIATIITGTV